MPDSRLVATDATDSLAYPSDFPTVHRLGIPHRVVHLEITNGQGGYYVWQRVDERYEIPGGHVNWLDDLDRPESYEEAAIRELIEELNLKINWDLATDAVQARLQGMLLPVVRLVNQVPSSHGNNNEWVTVYSLKWPPEWHDPCTFVLSDEGNKSPLWLSLKQIEERSLANPMSINAALRLFLQRRGILVPLVSQ
jgi:ADP-ribose pyrophosphatase YjhB (NUDIX family)